MKRLLRTFAVLMAAAVLGLGMAACDNGSGSENDGQAYTPSTASGPSSEERIVDNYISSIYDKTGINDRAELVKRFG
ncbi:MAG: response regulator transcription factor [Treponema sp.]|nr:response regulator transcription factor [Treponema sp.]